MASRLDTRQVVGVWGWLALSGQCGIDVEGFDWLGIELGTAEQRWEIMVLITT